MKKISNCFAVFFILLMLFISLFSDVIVGKDVFLKRSKKIYMYSPYQIDRDAFLKPPSKKHILGTDSVGRDIFARLVKGISNSFLISFVATLISLIIGMFAGGIAGYLGGVIDFVFSRFFELFYSIPLLFMLILLSPLIGDNLFLFGIVLGFFGWLFVARLVRGEVIKLKGMPFLEFARANGAGFIHVFKRHFFPHLLPPVLPITIFGFSGMLVAESSLSFLGLGVKPPEPSLGSLISQGLNYHDVAPWIYIPPSIVLFLTVLSLDIIGEYLKKRYSRF